MHTPSDGPGVPPAVNGCPAMEELERVLAGTDPPEGSMRSHVQSCDRCRAVVEEMRAADEFIARMAPSAAPHHGSAGGERSAEGEGPGATIGRYKLLQQIGEGGFGVVFLAEQREPVKRRVALKIIKSGMDSRQVIARFEAERQALAMMDHPNIAKVLDAGCTEAGRPYFVMELVKGAPIVEYCDGARLSTAERLEIFTGVCHAIQHAHQKGIIHRDIKPSNVLITLHDGVPVPKVIDFGIAKAINHELTEKTLFTQHRQMIGTPAYMSPEQAALSGLDIDTRSDIYSLGVLLYELLTGITPFDSDALLKAGFLEMLRIIREQDPPRPSTRLSGLGETGTRNAQLRHVPDSTKLSLLLRGDLDWIVMKCLEKDRTRRYATAIGLAADVRRHLRDEPVEAGPPRPMYRIGKFIRRHRAAVIGAAAAAVLLVAGVVATSSAMLWAMSSKDRLAEALDNESRRAAELEHVIQFQERQLQSIDVPRMAGSIREAVLDEVRAAVAQDGASPEEIQAQVERVEEAMAGANFSNVALSTLRSEIFVGAVTAIETEFADQPLLQARLEETLAPILSRSELADMAMAPVRHSFETRERLLGADHPDTLSSQSSIAQLLVVQGKLAQAEPMLQEILEKQRRVLGDEHPDTLISVADLGRAISYQNRSAEAEKYFREVLDVRRRLLGPEDPDTLTAIAEMGEVLLGQGRFAEAEPYIREALAARRKVLGDDHRDTLDSVYGQAMLEYRLGNASDAEACLREALGTARRTLGDHHSRTLNFMGALAAALQAQGQTDEAMSLCSEALACSLRTRGPDFPGTMILMHNYGLLLLGVGEYARAEEHFQEAFERRRRNLGEEHRDTLRSLVNLGSAVLAQGRLDEAGRLCAQAIESFRSTLSKDHQSESTALLNMAKIRRAQAMYAVAEQYARQAVERYAARGGEHHPDTLRATLLLCGILNDEGRCLESYELLRRGEPAAGAIESGPGAGFLEEWLSVLGEAERCKGDL
jgi:serine/threonine protein kinase/tetratricopeptide (TPR) repeat protein